MRPDQDGTSTELLVIHTDPEQEASSVPSHTDDDNKNNPSRQKQYLSGWRFTLTLASLSCVLVLVLNLGFILWAVRHRSPIEENEHNKGVLYEGPCSKVKRLGVGLHFFINILSTVLLAASNYCMVCSVSISCMASLLYNGLCISIQQCLSAPTRKDTDKVHPKAYWLDIGVPSVRNVFYIPKRRALLWLAMGLSSLPLHLM